MDALKTPSQLNLNVKTFADAASSFPCREGGGKKTPQNIKSSSKPGKVANTSKNTGQFETAAAPPFGVDFVLLFSLFGARLKKYGLLSNCFWKLDFAPLKGI